MKLLTQACVIQFFLCLLQVGKGNYSSLTQQISFIIQISAETLKVVPEHQPLIQAPSRKGWHERLALMLLERETLTTSPLTPQCWLSHSHFTLTPPQQLLLQSPTSGQVTAFALFQL